jgi:ubiquinone/menaquinone biosynthesis C-methylase UbiE
MTAPGSDKVFDGSIPELYDTYLTPLIFEAYARDLAARVKSKPVDRVLEVAAGTGVVTRAMVDALGADVSITATDLNQPMLDHAASVLTDASVTWQQADAHALPFDDGSFDAVVCQFAVMFFPDRAKAYAEARRVLRPGGHFYFNVWDVIEENEFAHVVTESLVELFPDDPPRFLARTPHGHSNVSEIRDDLRKGGFTAEPEVETITARSRASDPSVPAIAYCQGTPLRNEIVERDAALLAQATDVATAAVAERFGAGAVDGKLQAHVVSVRA